MSGVWRNGRTADGGKKIFEKKLLRKMKKHIDRSGIILYTNIRRLDV